MNVYVIINEWTSIDNSTGVEIVGANYFTSEEEAHESLKVIAEAFEYDLEPDETSIQLEDHLPSLQYEEYYITELNQL